MENNNNNINNLINPNNNSGIQYETELTNKQSLKIDLNSSNPLSILSPREKNQKFQRRSAKEQTIANF